MIIRCNCSADPCGRWKQPPMRIFHDTCAVRVSAEEKERGYLYRCRDDLTPKREAEIAEREKKLGYAEGALR